jgi:hypothetical protein
MAKNNYVDNKKFFEALVEFKKEVREDYIPPISPYIGKCFIDIANGLATKSNFMNYSYKDEMVCDGIENCISYCKNFNPEKSKNPFSYFTQIIYYAFLRRIEKEKKQAYIKHKLSQSKTTLKDITHIEDQDSDSELSRFESTFSIEEYEKKLEKKRLKNRKKKANLELFLEGSNEK